MKYPKVKIIFGKCPSAFQLTTLQNSSVCSIAWRTFCNLFLLKDSTWMVHYLKLCVLQVRHSKFEFSSTLTFFKLMLLPSCLKKNKTPTETLMVLFSLLVWTWTFWKCWLLVIHCFNNSSKLQWVVQAFLILIWLFIKSGIYL